MSLEYKISAEDQASQALDSIRQGAQQMENAMASAGADSADAMASARGEVDQTSDSAQGMGESFQGGVPHVIALNQALELGEKAMQAVAAVGRQLISISKESVEAWQTQDRALRDLERSYRNAGSAGSDLISEMDGMTDLSNQLASATTAGNEEIESAIAQYQTLTGSILARADAESTMTTVLGLSEAQQIDVSAAMERYTKIQQGHVRGIEDLTSMTREERQELEQVEDATERADVAMQALTSTYDGAAQDVDALSLAQSNLENAQDDVLKTWGEIIGESEGVIGALEHMEGMLQELDGWIQENGEALTILVEEGFYLFIATVEHTTEVALDLGYAFGVINAEAETTEEAIMSLTQTADRYGRALRRAGTALPFVSSIGGSLSDIGERGQELRDDNGAADALQEIRDRADEVLESARDAAGQVGEWITEAWEGFQGGEDLAQVRREESQQIERQLALSSDLSESERTRLERRQALLEYEQAQQEIREEHEEGQERTNALYEAETEYLATTAELREDLKEHYEEEQARNDDLERRNEIADLRLQQIREEGEIESARIARQIEMAELDEDALTDAELKTEQARIEAEYEERKAEIKEDQNAQNDDLEHRNELASHRMEMLHEEDDLRSARLEMQYEMMQLDEDALTDAELQVRQQEILLEYEEQRERIQDRRHQKQMSQLRERQSLESEGFDAFSDSLDGTGVEGLGALTDGAADAMHTFEAMAEAGEDTGDAVAASLSAGASASTAALEAMGMETRELAGVKALFEGAQAAAAYATGNIYGGVAHTAAAGMYASVASGAVDTESGAQGAAAGGSDSGRSGPSRRDQLASMDQQQMMRQEAHLEALRQWDNEGQTVVYNVNQNNSTFFERETSTRQKINRSLQDAPNDIDTANLEAA